MNFRVSFILLVLVVVVGGYVALFELQRPTDTPKQPQAPWFYDVSQEDIVNIKATYQGQRQSYAKTENGWVFEDSNEPVDTERWSGTTLLLSGPRTTRVVEEQPENLSDFGLDPPVSVISVTVLSKASRTTKTYTFYLGNRTPDGQSHYALLEGNPGVFGITSLWGDVINELVTRPPIVTPTATPEGAPTAVAETTPTAGPPSG